MSGYDTFIKIVEPKVETSYKITNENIKKGFNTYFTATDDSFILKTPKLDKSEDEDQNTIAQYFPRDEYLSIIDVLNSIDKEVDFLSSFQHYNQSKKTATSQPTVSFNTGIWMQFKSFTHW